MNIPPLSQLIITQFQKFIATITPIYPTAITQLPANKLKFTSTFLHGPWALERTPLVDPFHPNYTEN